MISFERMAHYEVEVEFKLIANDRNSSRIVARSSGLPTHVEQMPAISFSLLIPYISRWEVASARTHLLVLHKETC